jgi:hypothetical protein
MSLVGGGRLALLTAEVPMTTVGKLTIWSIVALLAIVAIAMMVAAR